MMLNSIHKQGERVMSELNVRTRGVSELAVIQPVATSEELRERLRRQHAASMVKLGARLLELELISREHLDRALSVQRADSTRHLGQVLTDYGYVAEDHLSQVVCEQLGIPLVELERFPIEPDVLSLVPEKAARQNRMLPLCCIDGQLAVAMCNPFDMQALEQARFCAGMPVIPVLAHRREVDLAIRANYQYAVVAFPTISFEPSWPVSPSAEELSMAYTAGWFEPQPEPPRVEKRASVQLAVVETVVSPEQLRERLISQHATTMLRLGVRLIELQLITEQQLEHALRKQRYHSSRRLGQVLFDLGFIAEAHLKQVVCDQLGIAFVALEQFPIDHAALRLLPEKSARDFQMLPLCCIDAQLVVAMSDPLDASAIEHARFCAQMAVIPVMALRYEIEHAIAMLYNKAVIPYGLSRGAWLGRRSGVPA